MCKINALVIMCLLYCCQVLPDSIADSLVASDSILNGNNLSEYNNRETRDSMQNAAGQDTIPILSDDSLKSKTVTNSENDSTKTITKSDDSNRVIIEGLLIDNETGSVPKDQSFIVRIDTSTISVDSMGEFHVEIAAKPYYQISINSKMFNPVQKVITFVAGKSNYYITLQLDKLKDTLKVVNTHSGDTSAVPWTISGTIIDSRFDLVIESDSTVLLFDADTVRVTENVNFVVTTKISGSHAFHLTIPGYHTVTFPVILEEKEKQLFIVIPTTVVEKSITRREITVSAKRLPVHRSAQIARIDVPRKELQHTTATFNDPIRVLHTLPGVASESDASARPIVQGGDVDEARVFLDGVPLLQPYHFGGARSTFNQQTVNTLTLYKTGFPSELHNAQSALIDVSSRVPSDEKPSFEFDLNPLQYSTYLGFPLFRGKAGLNLSSQGSFHEQILKLVTNVGGRLGNKNMEMVSKLVNIPDYKDFTAGISIAPSSRLKIFINEMMNTDRVKITKGDSVVNVTYNYLKWDRKKNEFIYDTSITIKRQYSAWDTAYYRYGGPLGNRELDGNPVIGKPWLEIDTIIDYRSKFNILYTKVQYVPTEKSIFYTTVAWQKRWWDLDFPGLYSITDELLGKNKYNVDYNQFNLNSGWTYSGIKNHLLKAGAQIDYTQAQYDVYILRYLHRIITSGSTNFHDFWGAMNGDTALVFDNQNQGILNTLLDRILVAYKGDKSFVNAAAYCSDGWDVSNRLHIDAGGRVEYSRADHITSVSPRLTVKYNVSEKNEILGSLGLYTQNNYDLDVIALSDNLKPEKVWHAAAGLETKLLPWLTQKIDVYGKYYYDLASEIIEQKEVSFPNPLDIESPVYNPEENYLDSLNHTEIISIGFPGRYSIYQSYYTNEGKGTAFGFEYMLRFDPTDFWHGWLSFTWGKSVRWRREGWRKHPFPLDRPLLISVNNYYRLPRKYEISLKYRYQSGIPYTSVKSVQDQVFIGNFNDNRYVGYQRFDIRFSKGFSVKSVKGNFYTEIWNAFNSPNLFGLDSKSRDLVTIVPNLPVTMLYAGVECVF